MTSRNVRAARAACRTANSRGPIARPSTRGSTTNRRWNWRCASPVRATHVESHGFMELRVIIESVSSKPPATALPPVPPEWREVLSPAAVAFVDELIDRYAGSVAELLARRAERQRRFDAGERPDFLADTRALRESDWRVGTIPADL